MSRPLAVPGLRLVVFDWDGTLIDSIAAIVDCTYAMLDELGLERVSESTVRSLIGSGLGESIRALVPGGDEETYHRVLATYSRLWFATYGQRSSLFAGARAVVSGLAEAGHLVAVATAKSRRGLDADLQRTGLDGIFDASRTADEATAKPSPAMLLEILDELGVRPREGLMVGDSVHDIEMARNAGVAALAVSSGAQSAETLQRTRPLACLSSITELPAWLKARHRLAVGKS